MKDEFVDLLLAITNKIPHESQHGALVRMAVVLELEVERLEAQRIPVSKDSLIEALKITLKKHEECDLIEKMVKIA